MNYASIMDKFFKWQPGKDDAAGRAIKNTFMADTVGSVINNQMAKDLAYTNAEIATNQMKNAAMLELGNQTQIMKDEFTYGMDKMGAEYDFQEQFANNDAIRQNNQLGLKADLQQNQTRLEGSQNRLNIQEQGREDAKLQDMKGMQAMQQLKQQGFNDAQIQDMKNSGAIDQINAQGGIDKWMQI